MGEKPRDEEKPWYVSNAEEEERVKFIQEGTELPQIAERFKSLSNKGLEYLAQKIQEEIEERNRK